MPIKINIDQLERELKTILLEITDQEKVINDKVKKVHPAYNLSAKNLIRYFILRSKDFRKYHSALSDLGVSSIRSAEGYVFSNLYSVVRNLNLIQGRNFSLDKQVEVIGYSSSKELMKQHADSLFSSRGEERFSRIMVTLPNEAAEDKTLIKNMVASGMEIARINLSHGNYEMWEKMVKNIREIQEEVEHPIKIYMDLSGPKLRTSTLLISTKKGKIKNSIPLKAGEHLILTKRNTLGKLTVYGKNGEVRQKAEVGVMLDAIIRDAKIDDVVIFDDGMIKARVIHKNEEDLELIIVECYKAKLSEHKGINLPNTKLNLPALTAKDLENLPFICKYADMVGYSFVRTKEDVAQLYDALNKLQAFDLGVIFKIENKEAFENLPHILLKGMERSNIGVMIARGDLAVELGFERISEVQNEILWICEAAHVPVIWATQVLENLAKTGIPTRAEVSDAAQAAQADCVMLNKGPHILSAIKVLKNILRRMDGHGFKKKNELRVLSVAKAFIEHMEENE